MIRARSCNGHPLDFGYTRHYHPSEKSVSTHLPLIEAFSALDNLVLDPFCGSASTLLAAKKLGHNYLGIELDPKYHAIALRRLGAVA